MPVFVYRITESSHFDVPVLAENAEKARKIFNTWYESEDISEYLQDRLDDGYDGRTNALINIEEEEKFPVEDILLPKEKDEPNEMLWSMHIEFDDGSNPWCLLNVSFDQIIEQYNRWKKYYDLKQYLVTDGNEDGSIFFFKAKAKPVQEGCRIKADDGISCRECEERMACSIYYRQLEKDPYIEKLLKKAQFYCNPTFMKHVQNKMTKRYDRTKNTDLNEKGG